MDPKTPLSKGTPSPHTPPPHKKEYLAGRARLAGWEDSGGRVAHIPRTSSIPAQPHDAKERPASTTHARDGAAKQPGVEKDSAVENLLEATKRLQAARYGTESTPATHAATSALQNAIATKPTKSEQDSGSRSRRASRRLGSPYEEASRVEEVAKDGPE